MLGESLDLDVDSATSYIRQQFQVSFLKREKEQFKFLRISDQVLHFRD